MENVACFGEKIAACDGLMLWFSPKRLLAKRFVILNKRYTNTPSWPY